MVGHRRPGEIELGGDLARGLTAGRTEGDESLGSLQVVAVTAFARRAHRPEQWTTAIAALTVAFALGQTLGPILAGVLSDGPSGVRAGLTISVAILVAGALLAVAQRHREANPAPGP